MRKSLNRIISVPIATLIIFLSGCTHPKNLQFLFVDSPTKTRLKSLQKAVENYTGNPDYYNEQLIPQSRDYQDHIHSLTPEQLEQEIASRYQEKIGR